MKISGPGVTTINAIATWGDTIGKTLLNTATSLTSAGDLSVRSITSTIVVCTQTSGEIITLGNAADFPTNDVARINTGSTYCNSGSIASNLCNLKLVLYDGGSIATQWGIGIQLGTQFYRVNTGNTHSFWVSNSQIFQIDASGWSLGGSSTVTFSGGTINFPAITATSYGPGATFTIFGIFGTNTNADFTGSYQKMGKIVTVQIHGTATCFAGLYCTDWDSNGPVVPGSIVTPIIITMPVVVDTTTNTRESMLLILGPEGRISLRSYQGTLVSFANGVGINIRTPITYQL